MDLLHEQLISLIRCSISGITVETELFVDMTNQEWSDLKLLSEKQSVSALALDGIDKAGLKPPTELLIEWVANQEYIRIHYDAYLAGVNSFLGFIRGRDIKVLVLKGLGLASYYPDPKKREFGDFDIYTFDSHTLVNKLIEEKGINIKYDNTHDEFDFSNIHIEHHNYFVSNYSRVSKKVNSYLLKVATESTGKVLNGLYCPPPDFNVVYLMRHLTKHLTGEGVTLRQIIDWGLFLNKEGAEIDWGRVTPTLKNMKMNVIYNVITAISEKVLGLDLSKYYIGEKDFYLIEKTINMIFRTQLHKENQYSFLPRLMLKSKRFFSHYWMYSSGLIPDNFFTEYFVWSVREHISDPSQI